MKIAAQRKNPACFGQTGRTRRRRGANQRSSYASKIRALVIPLVIPRVDLGALVVRVEFSGEQSLDLGRRTGTMSPYLCRRSTVCEPVPLGIMVHEYFREYFLAKVNPRTKLREGVSGFDHRLEPRVLGVENMLTEHVAVGPSVESLAVDNPSEPSTEHDAADRLTVMVGPSDNRSSKILVDLVEQIVKGDRIDRSVPSQVVVKVLGILDTQDVPPLVVQATRAAVECSMHDELGDRPLHDVRVVAHQQIVTTKGKLSLNVTIRGDAVENLVDRLPPRRATDVVVSPRLMPSGAPSIALRGCVG